MRPPPLGDWTLVERDDRWTVYRHVNRGLVVTTCTGVTMYTLSVIAECSYKSHRRPTDGELDFVRRGFAMEKAEEVSVLENAVGRNLVLEIE